MLALSQSTTIPRHCKAQAAPNKHPLEGVFFLIKSQEY